MSTATGTAERGWSRFWVPVSVLALGAASVLLLLVTDRLRERATAADRAWSRAVAQIEVDIAISHLWIEEHVSGDRVDLAEVDTRLARARRQASQLLGRGESTSAAMVGWVDAAPDIRGQAEILERWLAVFEALSEERLRGFDAGGDVGIGSPTDTRYDDVFAEVLVQTRVLQDLLTARLATTRQRSRTVFTAIVTAWSLLVAMAVIVLWRYENRRRLDLRALEDSQAQLLQSQKLEAVGRLAGGLAHDLNNYLAAIRGHCELARRKIEDDDPVAMRLDRAVAVVGRAADLIDRLQTFGRPQPIRREVVAVDELIEGTVKMIRPSLHDDIELHTELPAERWHVEADPRQLEQVLVNLLVNARDAMPTGGEIHIAAVHHHAQSGLETDAIEISVHDSGQGIPPELRERIFEPFLTTKGGRGRNGLGLAIVYGIVDRHGGEIEVESELGLGTVFRIRLPRTSAPAPVVIPEIDDDEPIEGRERILLVDDNAEFRHATAALLEELGYSVVAAADGRGALEACGAAEAPFEALLTDVVMPGIGGRELADRVRDRMPGIRVLFLSGHSQHILGRYGVGDGEAHVLKNAVSGVGIARRLRQLLDDSVASLASSGTAARAIRLVK